MSPTLPYGDQVKRLRWPAIAVAAVPPVLLAGLLVGVTVGELHAWSGAHRIDAVGLVLVAASALALALRRLTPSGGYALSTLLACAFLATGHPPGPIFVAPFLGLVAVIAGSRRREWIAAAIIGGGALSLAHGIGSGWSYAVAIFAAVWLIAAAAVGVGVGVRRRFMREVQARMQLAERSRDEEARRRMAEERLQIAREMHDVVGHSLAVISLQAGVADHLLETRPDEVRRAITAIRTVSKEALADLRVELALLRGNGAETAERAPAPTLDRLSELVSRMREAGLAVELDAAASDRRVPDIVAAAAYRIVQESLTNVVRHAGSHARARVRVRESDNALEVEVVDDGTGAAGNTDDGDGVQGMRERAIALGGEFVAGSRPGGGFRVWASLPWAAP